MTESEYYENMMAAFQRHANNASLQAEKMKREEQLSKYEELLRSVGKDEANEILSENGKRMWVELHNETGRCYAYSKGSIVDVPIEGVWR